METDSDLLRNRKTQGQTGNKIHPGNLAQTGELGRMVFCWSQTKRQKPGDELDG